MASPAVIMSCMSAPSLPRAPFLGVMSRLDYLCELGVTAIELMPIADFSGRRNWVTTALFCLPRTRLTAGREDLKRLVDARHRRGLGVIPDGLQPLRPRWKLSLANQPAILLIPKRTPWGAGINIADPIVSAF